ncbi:MAG TPA: hypothetical protein VGC41_27470, partial [Kofleriaceae bacterium]
EWRVQKVESGVAVSIVVDGQVNALGVVDASPETCAIRSAAATVTELLCGNAQFEATIHTEQGEAGQLIVTHDDTQTAAIPIGPSVAIKVAPYRMPVESDAP